MERLTSKNPLTDSQAMDLSLTDLYMRLKCYEDAEKQGRLVVLPCKVGDTVWRVNFDRRRKRIEEIRFDVNMYNSFGHTVFLTREEAEKALEGMR